MHQVCEEWHWQMYSSVSTAQFKYELCIRFLCSRFFRKALYFHDLNTWLWSSIKEMCRTLSARHYSLVSSVTLNQIGPDWRGQSVTQQWTICKSLCPTLFIFFTSYCLYHFLNLSSLFGFFLSLSQTLLRNILVTLKHNFLGWPLLGMNTTTTALTCCFTIYTSVSGTYYMLGFNWEK